MRNKTEFNAEHKAPKALEAAWLRAIIDGERRVLMFLNDLLLCWTKFEHTLLSCFHQCSVLLPSGQTVILPMT